MIRKGIKNFLHAAFFAASEHANLHTHTSHAFSESTDSRHDAFAIVN